MQLRGRFRRWPERLGSHTAKILGPAVVAVALVTAIGGSEVVGPTLEELPRVAAVERGREVIWNLAETGPSGLLSSSARTAYRSFDEWSAMPVLLGSWATLSLARAGWMDTLTAARFGWLLVTVLGPLGVYWMGSRAKGRRFGVLSAALLLVMPRWAHGSAAATEAVVLASLWAFVLGTYIRSIPGAGTDTGAVRRPVCAALLSAVALGLAAAVTLSALAVMGIVIAHRFVLERGNLLATLKRGRVPVPSLFLWALGITVPVLLALSPNLWGRGPAGIVRWLLRPLGEVVEPTIYLDSMITSLPVPRMYAAHWLASTTPLVILVLAAVGAVYLFRAWRRAGTNDVRIGALCALGIGWAVVWPAVAPELVTRFPPPAEIALPFIALLSAYGLEAIGRQVPARWRSSAVVGAVAVLAVAGIGQLATAAADFSPLVGGARRVSEHDTFGVGDGSELAVLAEELDALGEPAISLHAEVPESYWQVLREAGRLRTGIDSVSRPARADVVLERGPANDAFASVSHGGAVLWSASRP